MDRCLCCGQAMDGKKGRAAKVVFFAVILCILGLIYVGYRAVNCQNEVISTADRYNEFILGLNCRKLVTIQAMAEEGTPTPYFHVNMSGTGPPKIRHPD